MTTDLTPAAPPPVRRWRPQRIALGAGLAAVAYVLATRTQPHIVSIAVEAALALWLLATGCGWRPSVLWGVKLAFALVFLGLGALVVYFVAPHLTGGWQGLAIVAGYMCFGAGGVGGLHTLGIPIVSQRGRAADEEDPFESMSAARRYDDDYPGRFLDDYVMDPMYSSMPQNVNYDDD